MGTKGADEPSMSSPVVNVGRSPRYAVYAYIGMHISQGQVPVINI